MRLHMRSVYSGKMASLAYIGITGDAFYFWDV